jgi:hypothetical protein
LSSHGAKAIKVSKEGRNNNSGTKKDIFFKWGDKNERTIRLVGDFRWVKTHWIGKSAFGEEMSNSLKMLLFQQVTMLCQTVLCAVLGILQPKAFLLISLA